MIVRLWGARATRVNAAGYLHHFRGAVQPALAALPGFLGATVLEANAGDAQGDAEPLVDLLVLTRWRSIDAVRAFAGEHLEVAIVDEAAAAVLESYDRRVRHFTVAVETAGRADPNGGIV